VNKPRIYSVNYYDFMTALRKASNAGQRIEKTEKQRWLKYVRSHNVPEAAMSKSADSKGVGGRVEYVIITDNEDWEGYYVYSQEDEFCVKFDVRVD